MPCFLFTYHAYGSWLPGRSRGYVKRGQGILPTENHMHRLYQEAMTNTAVRFDEQLQRQIIATLLESEPLQRFNLYFVATDTSHIHVLLGWRDERESSKLRALIKGSLTRRLNKAFEKREWLTEGGSRKRVKDRQHFDYLRNFYLPKHTGWKWRTDLGLHR